MDLFCRFLFSGKHEGFTCIAHNSKGFDCIFIQQWLIKNHPNADMHIIHSGTKVVQLTLQDYKIRFIDSLNYFKMPLANLPKIFGLDQSVYQCRSLARHSIFSPETRMAKDRDELLKWHEAMRKSGYVFYFRREIYTYCSQDVSMADLFIAETGVGPFQ